MTVGHASLLWTLNARCCEIYGAQVGGRLVVRVVMFLDVVMVVVVVVVSVVVVVVLRVGSHIMFCA